MKKWLLVIAVVVVIILVVIFLRKRTAESDDKEKQNPGELTPEPVTPPTTEAPLFTDSGPGLVAVITRMEQLKKGGEYSRKAAELPPGQMFQGMKNPAAFAQIGGVSNILFPLTSASLRAANDAAGATDGGDKKTIMRTIQRANDSFKNNNLPEFLAYEYKGGGEKNFYQGWVCPNYGDCPGNWDLHKGSKRFPAAGKEAVLDMKVLASNIIAINTQLEDEVRTKAIQDLLASGYKFVGF